MHKKHLICAIIAAQCILVLQTANAQSGASVITWVVNRHIDLDTTYGNAEFDAAIAVGNLRLWMRTSTCSDVPCTVQFARNGNVGTVGVIGDGLDEIDSQAKLNSAFALSGRVKVVDAVDRCAGVDNDTFWGCGQTPGSSFIVETIVPGDVYVHEYGHNMNLGHRNTCTGNIMDEHSNGLNYAVDSNECTTLGGRVFTELNGPVSGTLTATNNPYWISGDAYVSNGQVLTLGSGVLIQVNSGEGIRAPGTGRMVATAGASPIRMFSSN